MYFPPFAQFRAEQNIQKSRLKRPKEKSWLQWLLVVVLVIGVPILSHAPHA